MLNMDMPSQGDAWVPSEDEAVAEFAEAVALMETVTGGDVNGRLAEAWAALAFARRDERGAEVAADMNDPHWYTGLEEPPTEGA